MQFYQEHKSTGAGVLAIILLYFSGVFILLSPVPYVYLAKRYGWSTLRRCLFISSLLVLGIYIGLALVGFPGDAAWVQLIPYARLRSSFSLGQWIYAGVVNFLFYALLGTILAYFNGKSIGLAKLINKLLIIMVVFIGVVQIVAWALPMKNFNDALYKIFNDFIIYALQHGNVNTISADFAKNHLEEMVQVGMGMLPSAILILGVCSILIVTSLMKRIPLGFSFFSKLGSIKNLFMSTGNLLFFIGTMAVVLINQFTFQWLYLDLIALNILLIFMAVFFLQGLGVFIYYLTSQKLSFIMKSLFLMILLVFLSPALLLLIVIGMFDVLMNFRKLKFSQVQRSPLWN